MTKLLKTPAAWPRPLLGRTGEGDPTDLDRAVKAGAFEGLKKAVGGLSPAGVVAEIRAAGLLGRG
ncbi:MAG TPA: hypothetical protein VIB99_06625, partial [Candidatus Limnocylindrales bacterium]